MADLQFHSNHSYSAESARGTAEESRPQQDRERWGEESSVRVGVSLGEEGMDRLSMSSRWGVINNACGRKGNMEKMDWKWLSHYRREVECVGGWLTVNQTSAWGLILEHVYRMWGGRRTQMKQNRVRMRVQNNSIGRAGLYSPPGKVF